MQDGDELEFHLLSMLGVWYCTQMKLIQNLESGHEGRKLLDRALELMPPSHPDRLRDMICAASLPALEKL